MLLGDDTSNYIEWNIGRNLLAYGGAAGVLDDIAGTCYCLWWDPTRSLGNSSQTGTPSSTPSWIGTKVRVAGTLVKGPNLSMDAARIGTGYDVLGGTGADPEANFAGIVADDVSTSEGVLQPGGTGYILQGKIRIGSASTACEFLDSDVVISTAVSEVTKSDFTEILIEHADTIITLDNCTFRGLYTHDRGRFEMITSTATVNMTGCTFQAYGDVVLGSGATMLGCNFLDTDTVTVNDAVLTGSLVSGYSRTADTSPIIWNTATNPDGYLDDMDFIAGSGAHAIEFGTSSPTSITLREIDFSGYNASNGQTNSTLHILRTTGTVTITTIKCTGNISYKTAGATVVFITNPVTFQLHVTDIDTGSDIQNARAFITPSNNTATYPWHESVTISRSGSTASVSHTAHNLSDGNKVFIEGADQEEYNGVQTITNVSTNAYDYTVSGTPTTPATGTIISTAVFIDGLTDSGGLISDFRPFPIDQPITGRVRKSSASPFYRSSPITGSIDDVNGLEIAVQMVRDE
jgi:hypothetical protein